MLHRTKTEILTRKECALVSTSSEKRDYYEILGVPKNADKIR